MEQRQKLLQEDMGERMARLLVQITKLENDYYKTIPDTNHLDLRQDTIDYSKMVEEFNTRITVWKEKSTRLEMEKMELMRINFVTLYL